MAKNRPEKESHLDLFCAQTNKYRIPIDPGPGNSSSNACDSEWWMELHRQRSGLLSERRRRLLDK